MKLEEVKRDKIEDSEFIGKLYITNIHHENIICDLSNSYTLISIKKELLLFENSYLGLIACIMSGNNKISTLIEKQTLDCIDNLKNITEAIKEKSREILNKKMEKCN